MGMPAESTQAHLELDELTLRRAQRGEPGAQQAFVETYQRLVFRLISRVLLRADPSSIEDAAQETFLAALKALPGFRTGANAKLSTWLGTIAVRRAIDMARRRRVEAGKARITAVDEGMVPPNWQAVALSRAMASLAPDVRAAFVLRELEGYSYEEIAAALAIPIGTVKSRLARARDALRIQLQEGAP